MRHGDAPCRAMAAPTMRRPVQSKSARQCSRASAVTAAPRSLWQAADGTTPLEEIVQQKICSEFEVDPDEALLDAETLARELAGHEILQISERPIPAPSASGEAR